MRLPLMWAAALAANVACASEPVVFYEVKLGDTLYDVSQRYLESQGDWRALARLNGVRDPRRLPPGTRLKLPLDRIRGIAQSATVLYVSGTAEAGDSSSVRALAPGERLAEGVWVRVLEGGFAGLALSDGSTLHLPGNTRITLVRMREAGEIGVRDQRIRLDRGRIDSTVKPLAPGSRFDIRTSRAVTGVRGTHFGVALGDDGIEVSTDVLEGRVAMAPNNRPGEVLELMAGSGAVLPASADAPRAVHLLPAPETAGVPALVERMPHALALAPLAGAVAYRAQVIDGSMPARVLSEQIASQPLLSLNGLPDGDHLLRLRAVDAHGLQGRERVVALRVRATPVPPLLSVPGPGEVLPLGTVRFLCTEVPGAAAYVLQVSPDPAFERDVREQRQDGHCHFSLAFDVAGEWHWRVASVLVRPQEGVRQGPFGDAGLVVLVPAPAAPTGVRSGDDGRTLHWTGSPGARYRVQLDTTPDFARPLQDTEVEQPTVQLDLQACRGYFVRVSTRSAQGLWSGFSEPHRVSANAGLCSADGIPVGGAEGQDWGTQQR